MCRISTEVGLSLPEELGTDNSVSILGMVHTGSESLQDRLRDIQTCEMILASAYVLCCLSAV